MQKITHALEPSYVCPLTPLIAFCKRELAEFRSRICTDAYLAAQARATARVAGGELVKWAQVIKTAEITPG